MDTFVGGVAKKIEKTYYEVWKTEAAEVAANKERAAASASPAQAASSSSSAASKEEKAPELRIENSQSRMLINALHRAAFSPVRSPVRPC